MKYPCISKNFLVQNLLKNSGLFFGKVLGEYRMLDERIMWGLKGTDCTTETAL